MCDFIALYQEEFSVYRMCVVLGVSRSAYHSYINGQTYQSSTDRLALSLQIQEIFEFHKKRYGSRRILEELLAEDYSVGLYQVRSIMRVADLKAIQPRQFVHKTMQSHPHLRRSPNLLLLGANLAQAPRQVLVGDITYLAQVTEGWLYLAVWMDLFSRRILAWKADEHMEESLVIDPLKQIIAQQEVSVGLIVHSDGGGQYSSIAFRALLKRNEFLQSMTRKDNHYDNAFAESLFSRMKTELAEEGIFQGIQEAKTKIFDYIDAYYNTIRRHSTLTYMSPINFEWKYYLDQGNEKKKTI